MEMLFVVVLSVVICSSHCSSPFTVAISTASEYNVGEDMNCKVIITNNHKDYFLLKRRTLLEGLKSSIFLVTSLLLMMVYCSREDPLLETSSY